MKILVVLPRFPYPLEKGDKLRAYHQVVELAKHNDIYLFCVTHTEVTEAQLQALRPYCRDIEVVRLNTLVCAKNVVRNWLTSKSLQMGYWNTKRAKRRYRQYEQRVAPDVVYNQMVRTMPLVARSERPKVMDYQDALSMNTERRMEQSHGLMRYVLHYEFKMLRSSEYNAFGIFDDLTIISETDSDAIPHKRNGEIKVVRNGVDFDYFNPTATNVQADVQADIVFCGNMQYAPNVDAARFLVTEVMPLVWQRKPDATVVIAGATPKAAVRSLAGPKVVVTGTVADIRPYYLQSKIFVAPMRIGSGLQNKLLEAMAMGIPCVTTPLANETLQATVGRHIMLGNTAHELSGAICTLLTDSHLRDSIAVAATQFVHTTFSWQATGEQLQQILQNAAHQ